MNIRGLYALTPSAENEETLLKQLTQALEGGVKFVQYREKTLNHDDQMHRAKLLNSLCKRYGATLIINDSPELVSAVGAGGIHVGQDDMSTAEARATLGPGTLIGASCYASIERAEQAVEEGADYVAFGSVFPSETKPEAVHCPLSVITHARQKLTCPIVAIGGISLENATSVIRSGADALAVISGLFDQPDVESAAKEFAKIWETAAAHQ